MDVRPFGRADVPAAAALLAARWQDHPLVAPFDPAEEIEKLFDDGHAGYAAPGGYLIGRIDADAAWSLYAGHAARDVATYRRLYRALGRDWVDAGQRRHAIVVPDGDPVAQEAFANLAFGREHVFALAALAEQPSGPPDPRVRVGSGDYFEALRPLFPLVARHLMEPPCWSGRRPGYFDTLDEEFRADLADPDVTYLVASEGGRAIGFATWEPMPARIGVPAGAYALSHMAVLPEHRGQGVGQALTLAGLALAREAGATVTWCDWRLTNMSAEPYWRTYGWRPYNVRYTRRVDECPIQ